MEASDAFTDKPVREIAIEVQYTNGWNTSVAQRSLSPHRLHKSFRPDSTLGSDSMTEKRQTSIDAVHFNAREPSASFSLLRIPKSMIAVTSSLTVV